MSLRCIHLRGTASAALMVVVGSLLLHGCHSRAAAPAPAATHQAAARYVDITPLPAGVKPWFEDCADQIGVRYRMGHNGRTPLTLLDVIGPGCAVCDFDGDGHADIAYRRALKLDRFVTASARCSVITVTVHLQMLPGAA